MVNQESYIISIFSCIQIVCWLNILTNDRFDHLLIIKLFDQCLIFFFHVKYILCGHFMSCYSLQPPQLNQTVDAFNSHAVKGWPATLLKPPEVQGAMHYYFRDTTMVGFGGAIAYLNQRGSMDVGGVMVLQRPEPATVLKGCKWWAWWKDEEINYLKRWWRRHYGNWILEVIVHDWNTHALCIVKL